MPTSLRIAVGERRLVHAAVDRLRRARRLAGRHVDQVGAGVLEQPRDRRPRRPACCRPAPSRAPRCAPTSACRPATRRASRAKDLERIAAAVLERPAVLVVAPVGERADERRQQIAVRAVQLEPVEAALGAPRARRARTRRARGPCRRASSRAAPGCAGRTAIAEGAISGQLPAGSGSSASSQPSCVEPFGPAWPSCSAIFAGVRACT